MNKHQYKGHSIEITTAGAQNIQNIAIDGRPVGYVVFPNSAVQYAKDFIDLHEQQPAQECIHDANEFGTFDNVTGVCWVCGETESQQ